MNATAPSPHHDDLKSTGASLWRSTREPPLFDRRRVGARPVKAPELNGGRCGRHAALCRQPRADPERQGAAGRVARLGRGHRRGMFALKEGTVVALRGEQRSDRNHLEVGWSRAANSSWPATTSGFASPGRCRAVTCARRRRGGVALAWRGSRRQRRGAGAGGAASRPAPLNPPSAAGEPRIPFIRKTTTARSWPGRDRATVALGVGTAALDGYKRWLAPQAGRPAVARARDGAPDPKSTLFLVERDNRSCGRPAGRRRSPCSSAAAGPVASAPGAATGRAGPAWFLRLAACVPARRHRPAHAADIKLPGVEIAISPARARRWPRR